MAIAGRVAIVPKGEWSQSVTYDKLDLVTYNGNTFIAYKSSVGVEPVDGDTWMLVMQGIDPQDIENIIDGTTPVGDSNKLGGKGASEYASNEILNTSILEKALTLSNGTHHFRLGGGNYIGTDLPNTSYTYGSAMVEVQSASAITVIVWGTAYGTTPVILQYYNGSSWRNDWFTLATTADLANYLPLTGGTVTGSNSVPLRIKSAVESDCSSQYLNKDGTSLGFIGFRGANNPTFFDSTGATANTLHHTGNKPFGSYTGNGDATAREISIGGIGYGLLVWHYSVGFAILTPAGSYVFPKSGAPSFMQTNEAEFNGKLIKLATTNSVLNQSGTTYFYYVL